MDKYLKSFLIVLIFAFLIFIFIYFFNKDINNDSEVETIYKKEQTTDVIYENKEIVYLYDKNLSSTIGVALNLDEKTKKVEKIIDYIFLGYIENTGLNIEAKLLNYEIIGDVLILDFDDKIFSVENEKYIFLLEELYLSFKEMGIKTIFLENKKKRIELLGDFYIKNGIKNIFLTNLTYLNSDIKDYKMIRIVTCFKNHIKVNNYLVDSNTDTFNFINERISDVYKDYKASFNSNNVSLDISYKLDDITRNLIKTSFEKTILFNFDEIFDIIIL